VFLPNSTEFFLKVYLLDDDANRILSCEPINDVAQMTSPRKKYVGSDNVRMNDCLNDKVKKIDDDIGNTSLSKKIDDDVRNMSLS
jgi:hypothetical protein